VSGTRERRKHTRISVDVAVDLASESNFYSGRTRDISMGGLFIETDAGLAIGTRVTVKLSLDDRFYELPAEVMWALDRSSGQGFGVGVQFTSLPLRSRNAILQFMKQRAPLDFEMLEPESEDDGPAAV
jgi:uncharacterized protein (TIGR02266 family)